MADVCNSLTMTDVASDPFSQLDRRQLGSEQYRLLYLKREIERKLDAIALRIRQLDEQALERERCEQVASLRSQERGSCLIFTDPVADAPADIVCAKIEIPLEIPGSYSVDSDYEVSIPNNVRLDLECSEYDAGKIMYPEPLLSAVPDIAGRIESFADPHLLEAIDEEYVYKHFTVTRNGFCRATWCGTWPLYVFFKPIDNHTT